MKVLNFTVTEAKIYVNHSGPYTRDVLGYRIQMTSEDGVVNYDVSNLFHHSSYLFCRIQKVKISHFWGS